MTNAARTIPEIPKKLFFKIGEVCEITDTQPYVLRFWESEFPQLAPRKNRSGQRVYQRKDIETVLRIKKLLYEEEYTIAGARRKLDEEPGALLPGNGEGPGADSALAAGHPDLEPDDAEGVDPEVDHPVDLLVSRSRAPRGGSATGASPRPGGDPDREARLEAALGEIKKSLRELLAEIRRS